MNLDPVRKRVADFGLRMIDRLHNLQPGRLEHRHVHHQRAQMLNVYVVTNQIEIPGSGERLVIESVNAEEKSLRVERKTRVAFRAAGNPAPKPS